MSAPDEIARLRAEADRLEQEAQAQATPPDLVALAEQIASEIRMKNWTEAATQLFADFLPQLVQELHAGQAPRAEAEAEPLPELLPEPEPEPEPEPDLFAPPPARTSIEVSGGR